MKKKQKQKSKVKARTYKIDLDLPVLLRVKEIAKLAGVTTNQVFNVIIAMELLKIEKK